MITPSIIFYALLGGLLPALLWLIFWLEEDKKHPEPRGLLLGTFILGMIATLGVLPLEKYALGFFPGLGVSTFVAWAVIEEGAKFLAAAAALRSLQDNEPIDAIIYMIVAALGFVALENALFIANPLFEANVASSVLTGNLRFIGASLLHIISSATIGASLAFSFYKNKKVRLFAIAGGFVLAVFFHAAFNLLILHVDSFGTFLTFATVWAGVALLFLIFEKVKTIAA